MDEGNITQFLNDPYKTFHFILEEKALLFPDKTFVESIDQNKSITYGKMFRVCNQIGHFLKERGVKANDRVVLLGENSLEHLIVFLAVLGYGATFCPINIEMNEKIIGELVDKVRPQLVLWDQMVDGTKLSENSPGEWISLGEWNPESKKDHAKFFSLLGNYPETAFGGPCCRKEDFSIIIHTSGTVGKPKGVAHTHGASYYQTEALALSTGMTSEDRILEYRSFSWGSAQQLGFMAPLYAGATVLLARKFSQSRFFDWLRDYQVTIAIGIPTVINMLLARPAGISKADFPHLRYMTSSSAPLSVAQHLKFEEMYGIKIVQLYGMTDGGWVAGNHPETFKIGTVGRPMKYQEVRIVDEDGSPCTADTVGEVEVGGLQRPYGYLVDGGVVAPFDNERLKTGDVGFLDNEGFLHITGRMKDLIIRGGVNIAPLEIDNVLLQHPDVADAATVGVPDPIYGEELVSYVVWKKGKSSPTDALLDYCRLKLSDFKVPREMIVADSIPKTDRGKVNRNALLEEWKHTHKAT